MTLREINQRLDVIRLRRWTTLLRLLRNHAVECRWRRIQAIMEAMTL